MTLFNTIVFFRFFSVLTMGHFLLPIVFENLFFPWDRKYFYFLGWVTALLAYHPNCFANKRLVPLFFFSLWYVFCIAQGFYNVELNWIRHELEALFFALIMLQYFMISRDYKGLRTLLVICGFFIVITLLTTLRGLHYYPMASRDLGGGLIAGGDYARIDYYQSIGIAEYDFFYGLAFALPVIVPFIKMKALSDSARTCLFFFLLLSLYGIFKGQFTTATFFALIGAIISFWTDERMKPALFRLIPLLILVMIFPKEWAADAINYFAQMLDEGVIRSRLVDLSITLKSGLGEADTHIDYRFNRIPFLIENFLQHPIWGGGETKGHNWWFDRLSLFGLSGVLPWVLLLRSQIKLNLQVLHEKSKIYYLISMILFILMGFMKNSGQQQVMIFVFFVVPALLLVKDNLSVISKKKTSQNG